MGTNTRAAFTMARVAALRAMAEIIALSIWFEYAPHVGDNCEIAVQEGDRQEMHETLENLGLDFLEATRIIRDGGKNIQVNTTADGLIGGTIVGAHITL